MTVCIAARCREGGRNYIVTVSDTKLSTGHYSGEMATLKVRTITDKWKCMISGTFAHHFPLIDRIRDAIGEDQKYDEVVKACTDSFIAENKRLAEESVLATFGLTLEQFVKSRADLGDSLYERTWADIGRVKVNCQLLVYGFDKSGPHILMVENPEGERVGFVTNCDFPGFASIGSGSYLAESKLYELSQHPTSSLVETLYATIMAKFVAESATDVGKETYIDVFTQAHNIEMIDNAFILVDDLRKQWNKRNDSKTPHWAKKIISGHLEAESIMPSASQTSEPEP